MAEGNGGRSDQSPLSAANRTLETLPPEVAAQAAVIERLTAEKYRLTSRNVALRHDLCASQQEKQNLRANIRSTKEEADIRIQVWLEKIAKLEAEVSGGERVKENLKEAYIKAQGLQKNNQELSRQIQQAHRELEIARADIKRLPELKSELEIMKKEHQSLRKTFEHEKGWNMEIVEKLKVMEMDLIRLSGERDYLRAQVANAVEMASVQNLYGAPFMNEDPLYQPPPHIHHAGNYDGNSSRSIQPTLGVSSEVIAPRGVGNATTIGNNGGATLPGLAGDVV